MLGVVPGGMGSLSTQPQSSTTHSSSSQMNRLTVLPGRIVFSETMSQCVPGGIRNSRPDQSV
jgi:hypothetical protein